MSRLAARLEWPVSLALILGAIALVAVVVVPAVRAHASAAPVNTGPPSLAVSPAPGSLLDLTPGRWGGDPTPTLSYQWLICKGGPGPADGSGCITPAAPPPQPHPFQFFVEDSDIGYSFRGREIATNALGTANALSDGSPVAVKPDLGITGCPSVPHAGLVSINEIQPPARLLIDRHTSSPVVITRSTQRLTIRFHVLVCDGQNVQGALVYATPTPYEQFIGPERATNAGGWATITLNRERFFPATPRQQNLIVFVRARKPGEDLLGGVSTRRLVSFRVRLG